MSERMGPTGLLEMPNRLNSVEVRVGPVQTKWRQTRFPRSKKKRIRKKWTKNRRNFKSENDPYIIQVGSDLNAYFYCDPYTYAKLRKQFTPPLAPPEARRG